MSDVLAPDGLEVTDGQQWQFTTSDNGKTAAFDLCLHDLRRLITCPSGQADVLQGILSGAEYPMAPPLIALCRGKSLLDIGAHCGGATCYFEALLNPCKIVAVEPDPRNFPWLVRNTPAGADLIPAAVSSHGRGAMLSQGVPCASSIVVSNDAVQGYVEVQTVFGWDVFDRATADGEIGVVKIDAEFSEVDILASAEAELSRCRLIWLEYHSETLRRQIDALLRDFHLVYSRGRKNQGVVAYLNRKFIDDVPHYF